MIDRVACAQCGSTDDGKRYWHSSSECDLVCRNCAPAGSLRCDYPISAVEHRIASALERIATSLEQRGGAAVARLAHNQEVAGSIPAPATTAPQIPCADGRHGPWAQSYDGSETRCSRCGETKVTRLPTSPAARADLVADMVSGLPIEDEDGNVIGRGPPLMTPEQARAALDMPEVAQTVERAPEEGEAAGSTPAPGTITAEQVRARWNGMDDACTNHGTCSCGWTLFEFALRGLLSHPGVSSSARAVIEAALE
jgi:hypothetical protein